MRKCFSPQKSDFLRDFGEWRHRGNENRFLVLDENDECVGYFASIPVALRRKQELYPAVWWMDLYVTPEYRGKGIQRLTDLHAKRQAELHFGFPNRLAAKIHRKHGWRVRDDFKVRMLPLKLSRIPHLNNLKGIIGILIKFAARLLNPIVYINKLSLSKPDSQNLKVLTEPDARILSEVFSFQPDRLLTVNRSEDYIRWRFLESPHSQQYSYHIGYCGDKPQIAVISRNFKRGAVRITRILDVFGDLENDELLRITLKSAIKQAVKNESVYITCLSANDCLERALQSLRFVFKTSVRLRCWSESPDLMRLVETAECHWSLADSDNDSID